MVYVDSFNIFRSVVPSSCLPSLTKKPNVTIPMPNRAVPSRKKV